MLRGVAIPVIGQRGGRRTQVATSGQPRPRCETPDSLTAATLPDISARFFFQLKSTSDVVDVLDPTELDDIRFCILYNLFEKFT